MSGRVTEKRSSWSRIGAFPLCVGALLALAGCGARWNGCVVLMRDESGGWRRLAPEKGFMC